MSAASLTYLFIVAQGLAIDLADSQEPEPIPKFTGEAIPAPPAQSEPWTPPEAPAEFADFIDAATQAFADGLADPRGCEYRVIKLVSGSCWGRGAIAETRGWVLPPDAAAEAEQRFAVAWNGLVYPLVEVGEPANLAADIEAIVESHETPWNGFGLSGDNEWRVVLPGSRPVSACLLLRLGETEAALASIKWQTAERNADWNSYVGLTEDWLWSLYNRAVCAHMRGDDRLSVSSLAYLEPRFAEIRANVDETIPEGRRRPDYHPLNFIADWEILLREGTRRLEPPPEFEPGSLEALIADLENIGARQWGQPGGVSVGSDPRVHALVKRGEEAIERLLDCLAGDQRLTRSVSFHRDFGTHRNLIPVADAAHAALTTILDTSEFEGVENRWAINTPEERVVMATAIRWYWNQNKGLSKPERWFATLLDHEAEVDRWIEAAENLTTPETVYTDVSSLGVYQTSPPDDAPMAGEVLRDREKPSLSEVLVRRAEGLKKTNSWPDAIDLATSLARWDSLGQKGALDRFALDVAPPIKAAKSYKRRLLGGFMTLTQVRIEAGDAEAIDAYVRVLGAENRKSVDRMDDTLFGLIGDHVDAPAVQAAGPAFFAKGGGWHPLVGSKTGFQSNELVKLWPELIQLPAFRKNLLACLADKTECGKLTVQKESVRINATSFSSGSSIPKDAQDLPEPGTVYPLRVCDVTAREMAAGLKKAGLVFEIFRAPDERDQQLEAIREHLQAD